MAKAIRKTAPVVFRDNEAELSSKLPDDALEGLFSIKQDVSEELSPFKRAKNGSTECFLSAEAFPVRTNIN